MNPAEIITAPDECKVFTPPELAAAMARVLQDAPEYRWLEPCVGKGVFLDALAGAGIGGDRITAVELDHHDLFTKCREYHPGTEFLDWSLRTEARFDRIIGNPPFLKLHKAHETVVRAALRIPRPGGGTVPLRANCWYAFLCACLRLLKPGGGLCLILPAGWEYADYAEDLRRMMPEWFKRFEIIRGARSFFDGILDGCIVLIAEGYGEPSIVRRRSAFPTLSDVIRHLSKGCGPEFPSLDSRSSPTTRSSKSKVTRFGEVARVRIGAVTGNARYFLMNEDRRVELGIDLQHVVPVLTRARQLKCSAMSTSRWRALRNNRERVWLFRPNIQSGSVPKAIEDYLQVGLDQGVHTGQKTGDRDLWYQTEMNPPADGFMSGMSSIGPWLCLNRTRELTATNTLYTVHFHERFKLSEKAAWALSLLSSTAASQHVEVGRCYSKGLLKFEPQDVMHLRVPIPVNTSSTAIKAYAFITGCLLDGRLHFARDMAEEFVTTGNYAT